ncbi:MAG: hypothetical protein N2504_02525 [candidate division WOR-3 bacterium]|nr:hypothetical protein [candidate division WOR-3 bacterium]MCX7947450.1 hypothetical protein [candidate division WOR-3 bacterium]MDW8150610.1 hypothetical protein [candidate division WOR-3 bacterium]
MRKFVTILTLIFVLDGCSTIVVSGNAELAPKTAKCSKTTEKRVFYALWGLVPITDNTLDNDIPQGKKIRVETKYTFIDYLINLILSNITIVSKSAEIYTCE